MKPKIIKIFGIIVLASLFLIFIVSYYLKNRITSMSPEEQQKYINQQIVGIWQATPNMAAGWNNRYHFFPDGRFSYVTSQMDCTTPLRQIDGTWSFKNGILAINGSLVAGWPDGEVVKTQPNDIECRDDYKLVDRTTIHITEIEKCDSDTCAILKKGVALDFVEDDLGGYTRTRIDLYDTLYWKMESDPMIDAPAPIGGNTKSDSYVK